MNTEPAPRSAPAASYTYKSPGHKADRQRAECAAILVALRAGATSREALAAVDGQGGGPANEEQEEQRDEWQQAGAGL
jgi:hypothetical protein